MGFSVSGAAAIVFAALFIAFGMWHSAATDSFERVSEAEQARADDALAERNTDIALVTASHASSTLTVEATNNGSTTLSLHETDIFIDNEYQTGWRDGADVDDDETTTLWQPGETLNVTFSMGDPPDRVKLVTEHGVADASGVSV